MHISKRPQLHHSGKSLAAAVTAVTRAIYRGRVSQYPGQLIMLCDRARVLARSDRPETIHGIFSRPTEAAAIRCAALAITYGPEVPWWLARPVASICCLVCRR